MLEIKPFRALRYDFSKVDVTKVVSPPYDVISDPMREDLYRRDPNNIIRAEFPKPEREDLSGEEKYVRAKVSLDEWIAKGVLIQEGAPSFYLYEQIFRHPDTRKKYSRIGLFCLVKLEEFESGNIIPHEKTHAAAKDDRFKLLKETQTNTSPIFGLYEDSEGTIASLYESEDGDSLTEFIDENGDRHRLVRISDEKHVREIEKLFKDKKIVIADGHHRYETALNYRKHLERLDKKTSADDYTLFCLMEWDEPGLLILPIHRCLRSFGKMGRDEFLVRLKRDFILKEVSLQHVPQVVSELERDFVIYFGGSYAYHAMLKDPEVLKAELPEGKPEVWYDLTVNWFSQLICKKILGLEDRYLERSVAYTPSYKTALTEVTAGISKAAFLLAATQKSELKEISEAHELMPQKSTYFFPKLLTGLVLYLHGEPSTTSRPRRYDRPGDGGRQPRKGSGSSKTPQAAVAPNTETPAVTPEEPSEPAEKKPKAEVKKV